MSKEKEKNKAFRYRTEVDPDAARLYAKEGCRHCLGRGYMMGQVSEKLDGAFNNKQPEYYANYIQYCRCFHKNANRYN